MTTTYAEASAAVTRGASPVPEVPAKPRGLCCVDGCQLPGSMSTATLGTQDWYCRLHFGTVYADQPQMTALAANRIELYRLAARCTNATPGRAVPQKVADEIRRLGRVDLLGAPPAVAGQPLTLRTLGAYMQAVLDVECRHGQHEVVEASETRPEAWLKIRELVGAENAR